MKYVKGACVGAVAAVALLWDSAAVAQQTTKRLTQTISADKAASAFRSATAVERRLPSLPQEAIEPFDSSAAEATAEPQFVPANPKQKSVALAPKVTTSSNQKDGGVGTENYGVKNANTIYHYNDRQIDPVSVVNFPQSTAGFFLHTFNGSSFFFCTASLISKSLIVTAGHCVHNTNTNQFIVSGTFYPACTNCNGGGALSEPYGHANALVVTTTAGWVNAPNEGAALNKGVDVAIVLLDKRAGTANEIGTYTGSLGFCYLNCGWKYSQLSQIGYPGNYDGGNRMNISEHLEKGGKTDYLLGTGMQGGSSGGPHISNLGALNDSSSSAGVYPYRSIVLAVTSWGYNDQSLKMQGASPLSGPKNGNDFQGMYNGMCNLAKTQHGAGSCNLVP